MAVNNLDLITLIASVSTLVCFSTTALMLLVGQQ